MTSFKMKFFNLHSMSGPASLASVISLLANVCLIGGAKQYSKDIILFWIVWKFLLLILFWVWYAYSMLKFHGYIDWSGQGMRQCYWCLLPEAEMVGKQQTTIHIYTFECLTNQNKAVNVDPADMPLAQLGLETKLYDGLLQTVIFLGFGGAIASFALFTLMVPVKVFHMKLKKQHRELTEYELAPIVYNPSEYKY